MSFKEQNNLNLYKPLYGIVKPSDLSRRFFGSENVKNIHNIIRFLVYRKTDGVVIEQQNNTHLMNIMRTIYLGYSVNCNTQRELDRLNNLVLKETVPNLIDSIRSHEQYLLERNNKLSFSAGSSMYTTSTGLKIDYN